MQTQWFRAWAVGVLGAAASLASGQTITGEISTNGGASYAALSGSPFSSGAAININVGVVSQDTLLRFYDGTAQADLGGITIGGTLGDPDATLSIIVANGVSSFPTRPSDPIQNEGARDVSGITITDSDLRDNTRVAIAATGNLTGPITIGHIFKLQFNGLVVGQTLTGAEINAPVTATAANNSIVTFTNTLDQQGNPFYAAPMAYVRASKKISAPLTTTLGDIGLVSIGTTAAATDGLQADVIATEGSIRSVYCAGAIGDPNASPSPIQPKIQAMKVVGEIVAVDNEINPSILLDKDFWADVRAGVNAPSTPTPDPYSDGTLHLIRTKRDYNGVIKARNIAPPTDQGGSAGTTACWSKVLSSARSTWTMRF